MKRDEVGSSAAAGPLIHSLRLFPDEDGEFVARVDFVVEGTKVVVEFDGRMKYAEGGPDALFAEKRRQDRLRRLGYTVIRVTWADLQHPGRIAALDPIRRRGRLSSSTGPSQARPDVVPLRPSCQPRWRGP